ncbi:PlxyGVORF83-like protein [Hyphantria cunea granulovirus]|uniref:PlxyGVORF83-like protein n=1 Tax=Hyphantria cunea granulovirus TaxID=307448 RepID=A0AAF1D296_9BBAC|nr:PlxyGVORF83-like protein [Hyphantria cunea granulovirus]QBQ01641.1 PlxyGVORF83-like protein [Hyphantria cunea granulovirus]
MDYHYPADGAHRHHELEKVQQEILKQHKHIENQLNQLSNNIKSLCSASNGLCDPSYLVKTTTAVERPSQYFREMQHYTHRPNIYLNTSPNTYRYNNFGK